VPTVRAHGRIDPLVVAPGPSHKPREVDRHWPERAYDHVIRGVQAVAVEQRLWQPLAAVDRIVSRAYLVAELLEPLALCRSDLPDSNQSVTRRGIEF